MKKYGAIDANQHDIVAALRAVGASVTSLAPMGGGVPDLLVGYRGKTYLLEIKDGSKPPSRHRLTPAEQKFFYTWTGGPLDVVTSEQQALEFIGAVPRRSPEVICPESFCNYSGMKWTDKSETKK